MTKENQKIYFLALFMVICAVFLRVIGKLGVLSVHGGIHCFILPFISVGASLPTEESSRYRYAAICLRFRPCAFFGLSYGQ